MLIKTKKHNADGLVRLETSGELREVIINQDLLNSREASVSLCFKGKNSSGIVSLSLNDIMLITRQVAPKMAMMQNVKVMKFEKELPDLPKKKRSKKNK